MALPSFADLAAAVWPDSVDVDKADVRAWGLTVETALNALFAGHAMINGRVVASVDSNVLTVALKTAANADPSSSDPVYVDFRNATESSGLNAVLAITSAVSITVSAGALVGFSDGVNGRLWVVIFNDGGTARLGVFNAWGGSGVVHPLDESQLVSSTDEAGDGSADSAGVIYTDTAVTSKPFRIVGTLSWETALGTAGLWSAAPDVVALVGLGTKKPGDVVQVARDVDAAVATVTDQIPVDDTIPQQSTEGDELMSVAITPKSACNMLAIDANVAMALSAAGTMTAALFQDSTEDALAARHEDVSGADDTIVLALRHRMLAGTQSSTTLKLFAGPSTGTLTFNGSSGSRTMGGVNFSDLEVREIVA